MQMFDRMLANVRALPGVKHAGFPSQLPLGWAGGRGAFIPEGAAPNPTLYGAHNRVITPAYFEAMCVPLNPWALFLIRMMVRMHRRS
jgi:hypothetical protein